VIGVVQQDQQIDVGVGVQLATAVAADGDQSNVGLVAPAELIPGLLQDVIDEPCTIFDQAANIAPPFEAFVEHLACLADRLFESGNGACL